MFDKKAIASLRTVGAFIFYKNRVALMIGPDKTGQRLGIMRFGGHIEKNEDPFDALNREIREEAAISVDLISSPKTYYKKKWDEQSYELIENIDIPVNPLVIAGDTVRSTAVFLAETEETPVPSSEAHGVVFLNEKDICNICSEKLLLKDFLAAGGKLIQQKELDSEMEIYAGPHLSFLFDLIQSGDEMILNCFR